jgi:hypothetical protein
MTSPNALTLASAGVCLAKRTVVVDGVVTRTEDPRWPRVLTFETVEVDTPDDLLEVLASAAELDPAPCVVRADPLAEIGRRAIYNDAEHGPAGLRVVPRSWVGYDLEKVPAKGIDPLCEPERAVAQSRRCLDPAHHAATAVWQVTASAGKRPDELRLRLWFLLDRPMLGSQIAAWNKPGIEARWLDPVTLRNEVIPHFLAVRIAGNSPDPCPQRWGIIRGERDRVTVPDGALVLPPQHEGELSLEGGGNLKALEERYGDHLPAKRMAAVAKIKAEIQTVRAAGDGARHPTYLRASARINALCEFWVIPIERPRELLEKAYLSTLTPDEARKRERGSTRGVWSWIGRRAA